MYQGWLGLQSNKTYYSSYGGPFHSPVLDVCPIATELVSISEYVPSYKDNHVNMLVNLTWPYLDKVFFVNKRKLSGA